jgi:thymidine kinase
VFAVGLLTDFQTRLFAGSQRLVELCDSIEVLQVRALCWCGERATHNARTLNGEMVLVGDQIVVGDRISVPDAEDRETAQEIAYEVLCRRHHRRRLTRAVAWASFSEPLPLGDVGAVDNEANDEPSDEPSHEH